METTQTMTTQTLLTKAADLIQKHGWIQRDYGDESQGFCLLGALVAAKGPFDPEHVFIYLDNYPEIERGYQALKSTLNKEPDVWNDMIGQTKEAVIEKLKLAASSTDKGV